MRREYTWLEYKQGFNLANQAEYARDFAGFANNKGGCLVFGVKNAPHIPDGLQGNSFENFDPARLSQYLDSLLSPSIRWEKYMHELNSKTFGVLYVEEAEVICLFVLSGSVSSNI